MRDALVGGALDAHEGTRQIRVGLTSLRKLAGSPRCLVVDWLAAPIIAIEIVAGVQFHD
jgi:hypothetical protein